ncbi:hypothetical protein N657DRAFT_680148 [Parathielavia appendiculata]|uniref:Uncharacterized protein n=1 Tax=Parathielavia appendiculata TaxID=2587402 RepID=A0AAN6U1H9_9PEZI|nr:hypothetical protein N657DRAFT_680148 [Parathielavia appendiculata]
MGCLCCLFKSITKKHKKTTGNIPPRVLGPQPVQPPGAYYQRQSQNPQKVPSSGTPFDPRTAANAAMAQAGACKEPATTGAY